MHLTLLRTWLWLGGREADLEMMDFEHKYSKFYSMEEKVTLRSLPKTLVIEGEVISGAS